MQAGGLFMQDLTVNELEFSGGTNWGEWFFGMGTVLLGGVVVLAGGGPEDQWLLPLEAV